jgi:putative zinc finger/helix-turn-helix YgiT family protein
MVSCYICKTEAELVEEPHTITLGTRTVTIDDRFYRCPTCGERFYPGDMADETLRRAAAKIRREEGSLTPDEIRGIREKYKLSRAELEQLIGVEQKKVGRWERGSVVQDGITDTLMRVLRDHPEVVAALAAERGVSLRRAA